MNATFTQSLEKYKALLGPERYQILVENAAQFSEEVMSNIISELTDVEANLLANNQKIDAINASLVQQHQEAETLFGKGMKEIEVRSEKTDEATAESLIKNI